MVRGFPNLLRVYVSVFVSFCLCVCSPSYYDTSPTTATLAPPPPTRIEEMEVLLTKVPMDTVRTLAKKAIQDKMEAVSKDVERRVTDHKRMVDEQQLQHSLGQ